MMNTIGSCSGYPAATMSGLQGTRPGAPNPGESLFSTADADGDGTVSKAEFNTLLQGTDSAVDDDTADGLFSQLDADGDGALSAQETTDAINSMLTRLRGSMPSGAMPPMPPDSGDGSSGDGNRVSHLVQGLLAQYGSGNEVDSTLCHGLIDDRKSAGTVRCPRSPKRT